MSADYAGDRPPPRHPIVVVMGVAGSGKSTVGLQLARILGTPFLEGDDLHPPANVRKMTDGVSLTDADREPWLQAIALAVAQRNEGGVVVSCSALKRSYRDVLRSRTGGVLFLHLDGQPEVVAERLANRRHFMPASLLPSQFEDLEPLGTDEDGLAVSIQQTPEAVMATFLDWYARHRSSKGAPIVPG